MKKRLYRSRNNKLIAGVIAGVAEYFDHDPTVWRLLTIVGFVLTGLMPGLLFYVLAWIIIPIAPADHVRDVPYTEHEN